VKAVKLFSRVFVVNLACFLLWCTIKDDNGALAPTGPHTTTGPATTITATPALIVTPDNPFVGVRETLAINITVMRDSTLTRTLANARLIVAKTRGWISAETLMTDSRGSAELKMMDTVKSRI
jgi:hypothetical protein